MSVITKDLGIATAYGYAKSKGYTGTEEEFAELMASYANVAQLAEASAQDAEDAKDAAVSAKNDAVTAKTAAESAQTAAAGSAQTASTKASEASGSAQTAAGSATAAGNSATAAAGSATTAQTAAQTATTKASEASSSASAASTAKTGAETARTGAQTAQTAAETAQANAEAAASSVSASAAQIEQNTEDITGLKNDLNEKADKTEALSAYIVETETGAIASFTDGADDVPVKDLTVAIEPVQSGSGDPSPTNVRPISGWTGANVTRMGKNLYKRALDSYYLDTVTGLPVAEAGYEVSEYILVKANAPIFIQGAGSSRRWFYDANKNPKTYLNYSNEQVYTPTEDGYIRVTLAKSAPTYATYQIEYGSTATAYEPYQGETYEVDWTTEAGTVYGGTLDVTTGVLTVDRAIEYIRDKTWEINSGRMETVLNSAFNADDRASSISSAYVYNANILGQNPENYSGCFAQVTSDHRLLLYDDRYTTSDDITDFVTDMGDTSFVYKLATPQTYQLTPEEVKTVLGQNNIFADTGNVTAQYRADTKLYIDKVLSA